MNCRILLLIFCLSPIALFSQVYRYTKEKRIEYAGKKADTVYILNAEVRIEVQIMKNHITIMRGRNGAGEPMDIEVFTIKRLTKKGADAKITTREGYEFNIYPDGMAVRYTSNGKKVDYSFWDGYSQRFRYEQ